MEQFGGWYQKERKLPGSAGRRNAAARPLCGRAFGACGAKAGAPRLSVYRPIPYLHGPCPPVGNLLFSRRQGEKKKGPFRPRSFYAVTDAYQNCPECR